MIEQINRLIERVVKNKIPFVIYKKPTDENLYVIVQQDDRIDYTVDYKTSGFVFAPFNDSEKTIIFKTSNSNKYLFSNVQNAEKIQANKLDTFDKEKEQHIQLVSKTIDYLNTGKAEKIVISRRQQILFQNIQYKFQLQSYYRLVHLYPDAFVYWWHHPKVGVWMGATPEKFINIANDNLITMSLAGTQVYAENINWTQKEINEQAIVTQFISEQLQDECDNIQTSPTFTKKSGHLAHLCTIVEGNLRHDFQLKNLIKKMHPTPAVCGNPKAFAKEFILKNEGYDRKFYTGFLGNIEHHPKMTVELYVNLRCMEWLENSVFIYVGGGITKGSNPINEWEETVNKAEVLTKIFD